MHNVYGSGKGAGGDKKNKEMSESVRSATSDNEPLAPPGYAHRENNMKGDS